MDDWKLNKTVFSLTKLLSNPRSSLSWVRRGHLTKDKAIQSQTYWFTGNLRRVSLTDVFPEAKNVDVSLPRAFDRRFGTSVTTEEACHIGAITKCLHPKKVLEIGTFDGNTALLLAANLEESGTVVTVDLPPDFNLEKEHSTLTYTDGEINLTPREDLGRQYKAHPLARRIKQVYGDSASLDWGTLGGPFDLIFVDGCHAESYVLSDSLNALKQLTSRGIVLWHDYGMIPDVSSVVDRIAQEKKELDVCVLEGTRLAVGRRKI